MDELCAHFSVATCRVLERFANRTSSKNALNGLSVALFGKRAEGALGSIFNALVLKVAISRRAYTKNSQVAESARRRAIHNC